MKRYRLHDLLRAAAATFLTSAACTSGGAGQSGPSGGDAAADTAASEVKADSGADAAADTTAKDAGSADTAPDSVADIAADAAADAVAQDAAKPDATPPDASGPDAGDAADAAQPDAAKPDASKPAGPFACQDPKPVISKGTDTGVDICKNGMIRRRKIVDCPSVLPEAGKTCTASGPGPVGECKTDDDCAGKVKGGHCEQAMGPGAWCYCASSCVSDADCGDGMMCLCGEKFGTCVTAACKSGDGCAVGDCVSYTNNPGCGNTAMVCENSGDECGAKSDCKPSDECTWTAEKGHKFCSPPMCAIGRPFVAGGQWQTAPDQPRDDWAGDAALATAGPDDADLRQRLAAHWLQAAQMEHASVAAFAKLALELLAHGAPPELVARAQQAGLDEVRHAQACFGLAAAYGGQLHGPGALPMAGLQLAKSLTELLVAAVHEGCVFETAAALDAQVAAAQAADPAVAGALAKIAHDESSHAELSWDLARWALAQPQADGAAADAALAAAVESLLAADTGADFPPDSGVNGGTRLKALRRHAVEQVIAPAWRRLRA